MSDIRVDTSMFVHAHGVRPAGLGSWSFTFGDDSRRVSQDLTVHGMKYSEAKRRAVALARKLGAVVVQVLP